MTERPPHAPYTVTLDEPIEVRVFEKDGLVVAEVEYGGDTIGSSVDPTDLGGATYEYAVDELVAGLARYVWHELGGVPVFREEDERFTARVDVQAPWRREARTPTLGLIANAEEVTPREATPDLAGVVHAEAVLTDGVSVELTPEELRALAGGEVPSSFLMRVVEAQPTAELLRTIEAALDAYTDDLTSGDIDAAVGRARMALAALTARLA